MSAEPGVICQIRAGRCNLECQTVSPDLRKGLLRLYRGDDALVCAQWLTREGGVVEESLYVFDDAYLKRVDACTDGEVYVLQFVGNNHKSLFWMQETCKDTIKKFISDFNKAAGDVQMDTD